LKFPTPTFSSLIFGSFAYQVFFFSAERRTWELLLFVALWLCLLKPPPPVIVYRH
jgi:hypothetical protein